MPFTHYVAAFRRGLSETGYVEGRNIAMEFRWAEGQNDRLPALAADLVRQQVSVIVATGGNAAALAAKTTTTTIPIVFGAGGDPVGLGLVASLNRPGGNATGVNFFTTELEPKRLGLLRELVPTAALMAVLLNPTNTFSEGQSKDVENAARAVGLQLRILHASGASELDTAFATMAQIRPGAVLAGSDPFFNSRRDHIVALAARNAIPAMYEWREFAAAGGLMSYGTSLIDTYRQIGIYTGRVLKGDRPADLPVVQSTRFEFVINLKTARVLGLEVPARLLSFVDEVIE